MKIEFKSWAQCPVVRWKNGKGETRVLADDSREPFGWRVSSAKLPAGESEFSLYAGYNRQLALLRGGPLKLRLPKREKVLAPFDWLAFSGDDVVTAFADLAGEDLNVFAQRNAYTAKLYIARVSPEETQFPLQAECHILFGISGAIEVLEPNEGKNYRLGVGDTLRLDRDPKEGLLNFRAVSLEGRSIAAWITIRRA